MNDRIKKLLMSIGALGALAAGGAAYASAQGSPTPTPTATAPSAQSETGTATDPADTNESGTEKADANDPADKAGEKDGAEAGDQVTGDAATKAKDAALGAVPGGKVGDISAEQPDANKGSDTPEPGDTPDPAYESKIAYDVEVTKADGSVVSVALDKAFAVLGTAKEDAQGGPDGENAQG
jgi:hypothetical protein